MTGHVVEVACCFSGIRGLYMFPTIPMGGKPALAVGGTKAPANPVRAQPPVLSPDTEKFPAELGLALERASSDGKQECGTLALAGPIVSVLIGFADGAGLGEGIRKRLIFALRRELRDLLMHVSSLAKTGNLRSHKKSLDVLIDWCSSETVPTYRTGVQLGKYKADEESQAKLSTLALAFHCTIWGHACPKQTHLPAQVPMLATACDALCGASPHKCELLKGAIIIGQKRNRSVSFSTLHEGDGDDASFGS